MFSSRRNKDRFETRFAVIADLSNMDSLAEEADMKVPTSIPPFCKRHRHFSRLSDDWLFSASFTDDLLDDLPFCPKSKPMEPTLDMTPFQARTSTPYTAMTTTTTLDLFSIKSHLFQQDQIASSMARVSLDKSQDSGRWSVDTTEAEEIRRLCATSLPRRSLENAFENENENEKIEREDGEIETQQKDELRCIEDDSAYESECFSSSQLSTTTELLHTSSCLVSFLEVKSTTLLSPDSGIRDDDMCNTPVDAAAIHAATPEPSRELFHKVLKQFTPVEPDRLIGRRMGRESVDIVSELSARHMSAVLSIVLKNVAGEDLCRMACVSKSWKGACEGDTLAVSRRWVVVEKHRLRVLELQKENVTVRRSPRKKRGLTHGPAVLGNVQTSVDEVNQVITRQSAQLLWEEEAKHLRQDEELRKCPQCACPAKTLPAQERAVCAQCAYDFCTNCQCVFHASSSCSITVRKKSKTEPTVGTRKSKKNLRRL